MLNDARRVSAYNMSGHVRESEKSKLYGTSKNTSLSTRLSCLEWDPCELQEQREKGSLGPNIPIPLFYVSTPRPWNACTWCHISSHLYEHTFEREKMVTNLYTHHGYWFRLVRSLAILLRICGSFFSFCFCTYNKINTGLLHVLSWNELKIGLLKLSSMSYMYNSRAFQPAACGRMWRMRQFCAAREVKCRHTYLPN